MTRIGAPGAARPRQTIRLVALDLDGTCLDEHVRLHDRTRDSIRTTIAHGIHVVIATGRMYRSALAWARELHVTAPLICYQGAMVRAMPTPESPVVGGIPHGELILECPVDGVSVLSALREARAHNWHFQAYQDDQLFCEEDRPEAHLYARIAQVSPLYVDSLEPLVGSGSSKVTCVVEDPREAQRCEDTMRALLGSRARVVRSLPPFIEITNPKASKRQALEVVCARLGIDMANTAAVGDAPNDIDMLAGAGFAVAVETDDPRLLDVADALCARPEAAGVADVLEALSPNLRAS